MLLLSMQRSVMTSYETNISLYPLALATHPEDILT